jgi:signal peptidase I
MAEAQQNGQTQLASVRETVESVWIAIVLAFVLRAFVLEAFVIPTGSMAPRLMGQHLQFDCPACGYHFESGVIGLANQERNLSKPITDARPHCPNCQYQFDPGQTYGFGGDRVLVLKYIYRLRPERPWDVVVFKNPQDNEQNFIKRLIGVPGQELQLVHGDVYVRDGRDANADGVIDEKDFQAEPNLPWRILRKPPPVQQAMWQVIFDNDYQPDPQVYDKYRRWTQPWRTSAGRWGSSQGGREFVFEGGDLGATGTPMNFDTASSVRFVKRDEPDARFYPNYAYNAALERSSLSPGEVVTDLKLALTLVPQADNSTVGLHLSSFADHFVGWVSADGRCRLSHGRADEEGRVAWDARPWAETKLPPLQIGRAYPLALTNADRVVRLWVDGQIVLQSDDKQFPELFSAEELDALKAATDAGVPRPDVSILTEGGPSRLMHVQVMRDEFYTNVRDNATGRPGWGIANNPIFLRKYTRQDDLDEFFVLGDNSPQSKDSRLWFEHAPTLRGDYKDGTVPRYSMIGKAFFVYWPGGFRLPELGLPLVPNVGRMRLIR